MASQNGLVSSNLFLKKKVFSLQDVMSTTRYFRSPSTRTTRLCTPTSRCWSGLRPPWQYTEECSGKLTAGCWSGHTPHKSTPWNDQVSLRPCQYAMEYSGWWSYDPLWWKHTVKSSGEPTFTFCNVASTPFNLIRQIRVMIFCYVKKNTL